MIDKCCETCYHFMDNYYCSRKDGVACNHDETWRSWEPKVDDGNPFNTQTGGDHYKKVANCPDVAEWCTMQKIEFSEGNVIKYVFRHERKNGFEDIEKAYQYLRFIAWVKYGKTL